MQMSNPSPRLPAEPKNRLPGLLLAGVLLIILAVIGVTTARRMQKTGELMRYALATQGELVVKSLEGATRFGMRHHMWGAVRMQSLVEEMLRLPNLRSLAVMDPRGEVLAAGVSIPRASDVRAMALGGLPTELDARISRRQAVTRFLPNELVVGRPFEPLAPFRRQGGPLPPWAKTQEEHMRHMMGPGMNMMGMPGPGQKPGYVLVRLSVQPIRAAQRRDLLSSLILAGVVFFSAGAVAGAMFLYARRRQRELNRLREEVAENQHLAAVGRLAGSVAHEVRNPLSALRGLVQFLAKDQKPGTRQAQCAQTAVAEVDRLERVVSGLLDYTRPRPPRLIPLDLKESIEGTLRLLADEPRAQGVEIESLVDQELPKVPADPDQVRQILMNLILNALEANNGKGKVSVSAVRRGDRVVVAVSDQGPGLPPGHEQEVFDPFFSTKERGSGLGLAIARRLARGLGGELTAGEAPGGGAAFTLSLPLSEARR
jgi:two-component system sensor histidine kinase HydH